MVLALTEISVILGEAPYLPVVDVEVVDHPSNAQPVYVGTVVLTVKVQDDFLYDTEPVVPVEFRYCVAVWLDGAPVPLFAL